MVGVNKSQLQFLKFITIPHRYFHELFQKPFLQSILFGVPNNHYRVLAGVLISHGWCYTAYIHTGLLHSISSIGEGVFIGDVPTHFKGTRSVIFNNLPVF